MIGQRKLFEKLVTSRLPKSNLFIGEQGCGKHTFVKEICDRHKLDCVDITDNISNDLIDDLYISPNICAYVIDIVELSKKTRYINKENAILKFVEEPPTHCIVFILAEYESQVIDTIKNRCITWKFDRYGIDDLKHFKVYDNEQIYSLLNTPGKLIDSKDEYYYNSLFNICGYIIDNIKKANISNTLSLEKHLEFVNKTGYPLLLFLKGMRSVIFQRVIEQAFEEDIQAFNITIDFIERTHVLNVNEKNLFDTYILTLKKVYDKS